MDGASLSANHTVAKDVYGYSLHYFNGDYPGAIGGNNTFIANQASSDLVSPSYNIGNGNLFNGNIGRMITTLTHPDTRNVLPLGNVYKYDQLNRIIESNSFSNLNPGGNNWGTGQVAKYRNTFTYDANGNIMTQVRYDGAATPVLIDNLTYRYKDIAGTIGTTNAKKHNRLYSVNDTKNYNSLDIDPGQGLNNYTYDAEGRLIGDAQEFISSITWRIDGKVKKITRTPGSGKENVSFDYDAMGRRIAKHTYTDANVLEKSTYYVLDARGNTMSVYERSINTNASSISYTQTEKHMYGSSRLGLHNERIPLLGTQNDVYSMSNIQHHIGDRNYELSNHLGNVLTVVSDKIISHNNGGSVDYYLADIRQATDYSPFGVILEGRNFEPDPYVESIPTLQTIYSTDFENPTITTVGSVTTVDGWGHYSSTTLSIDNTVTKRLKVVSTNGAHGAHQFFAVPVGVPHTLTVKIDKGTAPNVNILVFYNCPSMSSVGSLYALNSATSNGTYTLNFTSTTGYIFVQIRQAGTYYLDDISITNNSGTGGTLVHSRAYRYGFNNMEKDDELKGGGNSYDFGARILDPRIGRWLTIDPLAVKYPDLSTYNFVANSPIIFLDPDGRVITFANTESENLFNKMYSQASETKKAQLDKLKASEIVYHVNVENPSENLPMGGYTTYNFSTKRIEMNIAIDGDVTGGILADETTHAYQFEVGDIGYIKTSSPEGDVVGYDLEDEVASKRSAVEAATKDGVKLSDLDPENKYESTKINKLIEDGKDTDAAINEWFNSSPNYNELIKDNTGDKGDQMGKHVSAEEAINSMRNSKGKVKGASEIIYRKENKTITQ
ncbi:hypothetical protein D3C86_1085330 [compost metagenome]